MSLTTKLIKTLTYLDVLLPIKLHDTLITRSCETTLQAKFITTLLPLHKGLLQEIWPNPQQTCDLPWRASNHNVTQSFGYVVLRDHVRNYYISTIRKSIATKLGRMVIYLGYFLPRKSKWPYNHVALWDHVKNLKRWISTRQCSWSQNVAWRWLTLSEFYP